MTNKTVAIFGAGPAFGYQVAKKFAKEGYQVALISRTQSKLEYLTTKLQQEIPSIIKEKIKYFVCDLLVGEQITKTVADILSAFGSLDVVYCGIIPREVVFVPAAQLTPEFAIKNLHIYFLSSVALIQAVLPSLLSKQSGAIVLGAAITATKSIPYFSGPGPAMAALRQYSLALNLELKEQNIHVGIIVVGGVIEGSEVSDYLIQENKVYPLPRIDANVLGNVVWDMVANKVAELTLP